MSQNTLHTSASRYLRQHASQPVHWRPWSAEAFEEAAIRDIPVLVSIGYSACHWCHVMAHECFDDPEIAEQMNTNFVCIKVDREEHPAVDAYCMDVVQRLTGSGGWPLNAFLTPQQEAFFAGTYYPPRPSHARPSWPQLLSTVSSWWEDRRSEVEQQARTLSQAFTAETILPSVHISGPQDSVQESFRRIATSLRPSCDQEWGGFGDAPKFPPAMLMTAAAQWTRIAGHWDGWDMVTTTLDAIAAGGIRDFVHGGFARYSVDRTWTVPHFEKMAYDQAMLMRAFTWAHLVEPDKGYDQVVREIVEYLVERLQLPSGLFAASHDADTPEGEGRAACWSPEELEEVLGPTQAATIADHFSVHGPPTFRDPHTGFQSWVLHRAPGSEPLPDWQEIRARLIAATASRPQVERDDKAILAWNAYLIRALSEAGRILQDASIATLATDVAEMVWDSFQAEGRWFRIVHATTRQVTATSEDLAAMAWASVELGRHDPVWYQRAERLLKECWEQFANDDQTAVVIDQLDDIPARPTFFDNATPSPNSLVVNTAAELHAATGSSFLHSFAERTIQQLRPVLEQHPNAVGCLLEGLLWLPANPIQCVEVSETAERDMQMEPGIFPLEEPLTTFLHIPAAQRALFPMSEYAEPRSISICRSGVCALPSKSTQSAVEQFQQYVEERRELLADAKAAD